MTFNPNGSPTAGNGIAAVIDGLEREAMELRENGWPDLATQAEGKASRLKLKLKRVREAAAKAKEEAKA